MFGISIAQLKRLIILFFERRPAHIIKFFVTFSRILELTYSYTFFFYCGDKIGIGRKFHLMPKIQTLNFFVYFVIFGY